MNSTARNWQTENDRKYTVSRHSTVLNVIGQRYPVGGSSEQIVTSGNSRFVTGLTKRCYGGNVTVQSIRVDVATGQRDGPQC